MMRHLGGRDGFRERDLASRLERGQSVIGDLQHAELLCVLD